MVKKHLPEISPGLSAIVRDWAGFEELVASIHASSAFTVSTHELVQGRDGSWVIDVVVRSSVGIHEYVTIIECKYWNNAVGRDQITHLKCIREDVNASKAVIFTTVGYQDGAEEFARRNAIDVYVIRDLTNEEWGAPGRHINLFLQVASKAVVI